MQQLNFIFAYYLIQVKTTTKNSIEAVDARAGRSCNLLNKKSCLSWIFYQFRRLIFITYHDFTTTFNPVYFRLYRIPTKRKRAENRHFCRISYTFGGGGDESRTRVRKPIPATFYERSLSFQIPNKSRRQTGYNCS